MTEPPEVALTESPLAPLDEPTKRSALIAEALRDAILSGRLAPGAVLVERTIAAQLGVSKTPVREALISLASSGLVSVNTGRGATVRVPVEDDVRRIYQVRSLLEPWAAHQAAGQDTAVGDATAALDEAKELLDSGDHAALSRVNRTFHRALYAQCGNDIVVDQLDALQDLTALCVIGLLWERWPRWREEWQEHADILAAVRGGEGDTAERLMRSHITASLHRLG